MLVITVLMQPAFAGSTVLILSVVAERLASRAADIIAGAPLGALIWYYLLRIEKGIYFLTAGIPHVIVGISSVLIFAAAY